jgi:long-chain fatty acid transport protein
MKRITGHLAVSATLLGISGWANAAGFALIEQGGSGIGNAYAGAAAVAEDATTIFFNPAGMTYLPDSQLVIAAHAIKPYVDFSNQGSRTLVGTPFVQPLTGGDGGDAGDWAFVPNLYYAKAVNDALRLGIGVNAPFGLKTEYDDNWAGRYHAIKSELQTININPSLALKVNDMVSLGAGVSYQYAEAELTNAIDFGTICYGKLGPATCNFLKITPQADDGQVKIKGNDWSWGYNLGALFQPMPGTRLGLAYRSEIKQELDGHAYFSSVPAAFAADPHLAYGKVKAEIKLPASASLSAFHQVNDQWDILADLTWTEWSSFQELRVIRDSGPLAGQTLSAQPEKWHNAIRTSLGANYHYSDALKLRAGVAYDESPVSNTYRTPRIPDSDRTWLSLGANYKFSQNSSVDAAYTHIFVKDSSVNQTSTSGGGNLVGDYNNDINMLSVQYTHNF